MALDPRVGAAQAIGEVLAGQSLNRSLPPKLALVAERDRGLLQQLCYGTLRSGPRLQALLAQLLNKPLKNKDSDLQGLLLCGLYQLESTRIPDHAAVSSTVAAVAGLNKAWAKNMANAVLRRFIRERVALERELSSAAKACHPDWLYRKLRQQWADDSDAIISANNLQAPMTLRVNRSRCTREHYLAKLDSQGIEARAGHFSPQAVTLSTPLDVTKLPGFYEGEVSVQDEAAQLAAYALNAAPGERILDACAAPGGKSCHILELQPQLTELVAMDVDADRLDKVKDNLRRLKLKAKVLAGDASAPPNSLTAESFDRILVDAPCSATGVIRRHPDVKILRRATDIDSLAESQQHILSGLWPLLKPGGKLVYATCSVLAEENAEVVKRFIANSTEASCVELTTDWGQPAGPGRQLLPTADGTDGLFYALMEKRA